MTELITSTNELTDDMLMVRPTEVGIILNNSDEDNMGETRLVMPSHGDPDEDGMTEYTIEEMICIGIMVKLSQDGEWGKELLHTAEEFLDSGGRIDTDEVH